MARSGTTVRLERETVSLPQRQMAQVFDTTPENLLMHLRNTFVSGELEADATTKEFLIVRAEGRGGAEVNAAPDDPLIVRRT